VHTPGQKTIEDVARFLGVSPKNKIKTLALMVDEKDSKTGKVVPRPVVVLLRGDHQLNEAKLSSAVEGKRHAPCKRRKSSGCSGLRQDFWDQSVLNGRGM